MSEESFDLSSISSGVRYLADGYFDYCSEVISGRAIADYRDGLKPVQRRIIVTLKNEKGLDYKKSARIAGNTMALHPHGDAAIYAASVLMTDKNGTLAFPLLSGSGSFGGVYKTDPAAAMRYTEVKLHSNTLNEYFGELNGVRFIPNFDATLTEPEVLPVSFPAVLVNSSSGIAVGFRTNTPSFNFNDVCDLVTEYIDNGKCTTVIYPDFVTGGYYVRDEKEALKLMKYGKGRIKLRGRSVINGKNIDVTEVPYGKTIQGLLKQINDKDISCIKSAYDTDDFDSGMLFSIVCTAKNRTDEALYELYKNTDFQYTYSADMTVIVDGAPKRLGVWDLIANWVAWRREVLTKEYTVRLEAANDAIRESEAFMNIIKDEEKKIKLVNIIAQEGRDAGYKFIEENYTREEVPADLIQFVSSRRLPDYNDGGKYTKEYEVHKNTVVGLEKSLANIDAVIKAQMEALKLKYGVAMKRRTEITDTDYDFSESTTKEDVKVEDTSSCYYIIKNGFIKKLAFTSVDESADFQFSGKANDTIVAIDNYGRILRVYCNDLPFDSVSNTGLYIARYCGIEAPDDYRIIWAGKLEPKEVMLLYKDGNVGFINMEEWIGNTRNVRVLERGIASGYADLVGKVFEEVPDVLYVTDTSGRLAWVDTADLKRKDRTARTRAFVTKGDALIDSYACYGRDKAMLLLNNASNYYGKLKEINLTDFRGSAEDFVLI